MGSADRLNAYGVDLARIHHEAYDELARRAGPAVVACLRQAGIHSGLVRCATWFFMRSGEILPFRVVEEARVKRSCDGAAATVTGPYYDKAHGAD
jgi:hypothetical protein